MKNSIRFLHKIPYASIYDVKDRVWFMLNISKGKRTPCVATSQAEIIAMKIRYGICESKHLAFSVEFRSIWLLE